MNSNPLTIWKYQLRSIINPQLHLPVGAKVLLVQTQAGVPCLWALVNPEAPTEPRTFLIVGTGHAIHEPLGDYVGTFQLDDGLLVFHVFDQSKGGA